MSQITTIQAGMRILWHGPMLDGLPEGTEFVVPDEAAICYLRTANCITYWRWRGAALDALDQSEQHVLDVLVTGARKLKDQHELAAVYNVWPGWRV